jgi:NADPH:quinone reductase-like Zn-dependent oxidoreductase
LTCRAPGPGAILGWVYMGGVCGTDVSLRRGDFTLPIAIVLGHEGTAVVEQLGDGVTHDSAASRSLSETTSPGLPSRRATTATTAPSRAASPRVLVTLPPGMAVYRIPDGTSPEAVIALGCALPPCCKASTGSGCRSAGA